MYLNGIQCRWVTHTCKYILLKHGYHCYNWYLYHCDQLSGQICYVLQYGVKYVSPLHACRHMYMCMYFIIVLPWHVHMLLLYVLFCNMLKHHINSIHVFTTLGNMSCLRMFQVCWLAGTAWAGCTCTTSDHFFTDLVQTHLRKLLSRPE